MPFLDTPIKDLYIFEPKVFADDRGYFFESFNARTFAEKGIQVQFVQDNQARSGQGVLRGLHYQVGKYAQTKLVRVLSGEILDVVVDLRAGSLSYGHHFKVILSAENKRQLFVPKGFAHGYVVRSKTADFFYKCDNFYAPGYEGGIIFNDPALAIDWEIQEEDLILSPKDQELPRLGQHRIDV